jgi:TolB-like protein
MEPLSGPNLFLGMLLAIITLQAPLQAGQVVTDVQRQWARQALKNENSMQGKITAPQENTLAVLYLHNKSGRPQWNILQKGLAVMLISDLARVEKIQVVERIKLQALLDEMKLGASGLVEADNIPRMGNLLGVSYVAGGDILQGTSTELVIDPAILDIPDEMMLNQPYAYGSIAELIVVEKKLLFDIIRTMEIQLTPQEKRELEKPLSISSAALLALFAAISQSDQGNYAKAAEAYTQALEHDSRLTFAQDALTELHQLGLIGVGSATTSTEDRPLEHTQDPLPSESGGSSIGTILAVGIGLAAIGGGVALALGGSDSEEETNISNSPPETDPSDDTDDTDETDETETDSDTPTDEPSDSPPSDTEPQPDSDVTPPEIDGIVPDPGSDLACDSGQIIFDFSEAMDTSSSHQVQILDSQFSFSISIDWGRGDTRAVVSYTNEESGCDSAGVWREEDVRVSLSGFRDLGGNPLGGSTVFDYVIRYRVLL